jgi:hypothetical protein
MIQKIKKLYISRNIVFFQNEPFFKFEQKENLENNSDEFMLPFNLLQFQG